MTRDSAYKGNAINNYYTTVTRHSKRLNTFNIILTIIALINQSVLTSGTLDVTSRKSNDYLSPLGYLDSWRQRDFRDPIVPEGHNRINLKITSLKDGKFAPRNYDKEAVREHIEEDELAFLPSLAKFRDSAVEERIPIVARSNFFYRYNRLKPYRKLKSSQVSSEFADQEQQQNEICSKLRGDKSIRPREVEPDPLKDLRDLGQIDVIHQILKAISGGVNFMGREYPKVNLDAIVGTRILEGQLTVLLKRLETGDTFNTQSVQLSDSANDDETAGQEVGQKEAEKGGRNDLNFSRFILELKLLLTTSINISDAATDQNKRNQPRYFQRIGTLLKNGMWELDYESRDVDPALLEKLQMEEDGDWKELMRESESDDCLTELFGTVRNSKAQTCSVTSGCWTLMTSPGFSGYSLTHQVFYQQIGQLVGCFNASALDLQRSDKISAKFCTKILHQAQTIAMCDFPGHLQDLFMEQAGLCGMLGYRQFFRRSWLQEILASQNQHLGCWIVKKKYGERNAAQSQRDAHTKSEELQGMRERVRREEKILEDGCASHKTAVALSALIGYLRYALELLFDNPSGFT